jgi:hypothetical protein
MVQMVAFRKKLAKLLQRGILFPEEKLWPRKNRRIAPTCSLLKKLLPWNGNSNWRGPIWFPVNFLIIEALERYFYFYGETFTIEYPRGSGTFANLRDVAIDLCDRLVSLFLPNQQGYRPCFGSAKRYSDVPHWRDLLLFHEYFHAETGEGIGASHQTGWTSLVVTLVSERREYLRQMTI